MKKIGQTIFLALSCGLLHASEHADLIFIYSHGMTSSEAKAGAYKKAKIIPESTHHFNYSDAYLSFEPSRGYGVALDFWSSCIGQNADTQKLLYNINNHPRTVLFGESRGASAILNGLGSLGPQQNHVIAAVLDSPFDTVNSVIDYQISRLGLQLLGLAAKRFERAIPYFCWNYDPNGIQPIKSIENIDPNTPMLFIASAQDTVVPYKCSVELYKKLFEQGHENVYLLPLAEGKHGWIMQGPQKELYRDVIHAFYQKHKINHGIESDDISPRGHDILEDYCRPNKAQLAQSGGVKFLRSH